MMFTFAFVVVVVVVLGDAAVATAAEKGNRFFFCGRHPIFPVAVDFSLE